MTTPQEIYDALRTRHINSNQFYRWLGASLIGHSCTRAIALQFRQASHDNFTGQTLRIFRNGHEAENRIIADLISTGKIKIHSEQDTYELEGGLGHSGSTIDGIAEEDGVQMVLELKTANAKKWDELAKKTVKVANPRYYAQCQVNMLNSGLYTALFVAENKNTNELYIEYIPYDPELAQKYANVARHIINGGSGEKCSDRPDYYECKWCNSYNICHGESVPRAHCLTCCHSTPIDGGKFICALYKNEVPEDFLSQGCSQHVYIPWMINLPMQDAGEYWVQYDTPEGTTIFNCALDSFPKITEGTDISILLSHDWEKLGLTKPQHIPLISTTENK